MSDLNDTLARADQATGRPVGTRRALAGDDAGGPVRLGLTELAQVKLDGRPAGAPVVAYLGPGDAPGPGAVIAVRPTTDRAPQAWQVARLALPPVPTALFTYIVPNPPTRPNGVYLQFDPINPGGSVSQPLSGGPGFSSPFFFAAAGGWACSVGGPTITAVSLYRASTGWIAQAPRPDITPSGSHAIFTVAAGGRIYLVYRADPDGTPLRCHLRIYAFTPPAMTVTLVAELEIGPNLVVWQVIASPTADTDIFVSLRQSDLSANTVVHWNALTWQTLTLPRNATPRPAVLVPDATPAALGAIYYLAPTEGEIHRTLDRGATWNLHTNASTEHLGFMTLQGAQVAAVNGRVYATSGLFSPAGFLPDGQFHWGPPYSPGVTTDRSWMIECLVGGGSWLRYSTAWSTEIRGVAEFKGDLYWAIRDDPTTSTPYLVPYGVYRWDPATHLSTSIYGTDNGPRGLWTGDAVFPTA